MHFLDLIEVHHLVVEVINFLFILAYGDARNILEESIGPLGLFMRIFFFKTFNQDIRDISQALSGN